ncbi:hypothetical protein MES4922_110366 [Mesorhizobium ventifaucium]|uniref:Uncharacterized protein n=1 Tax=Mesorhizobium ventifaucium TaxID=666020 RepID=A0ABM9DEP1_9HYPH|nr:hypothetical protein MES4922_110366 [Mesorhizobium ventifaucium]
MNSSNCKIRVTKFDVYVKRRRERRPESGWFCAGTDLKLACRTEEERAACTGHQSRTSPSH